MENEPDIKSPVKKHQFLLFVSGMSINSSRAIENLRRICNQYIPNEYTIEIIDISRDREDAVTHQIVGVPTLIRITPDPKRMIIGDLSNTEKVLRILDIMA